MSDYEYRVEVVDLPYRVPSLVSYDQDGFPTILVNARYGHNAQCDAVDHEIIHIENDDINSDEDIRSVERRAG